MDGEGLKLSCPNKCLAIMCIWCFCLMEPVKWSIVASVGETRGKCWGVTGANARLPSVQRRPLIKVALLRIEGIALSSALSRAYSARVQVVEEGGGYRANGDRSGSFPRILWRERAGRFLEYWSPERKRGTSTLL